MDAARPRPPQAHRHTVADRDQRERDREREATPSDPPDLLHLAHAVAEKGIILKTADQTIENWGQFGGRPIALAHIYRIAARHLDSHHSLEIELRQYSDVADVLGFEDGVPDDSTFSYWWREKFTDATQDLINDIAETVRKDVLSETDWVRKGGVEPFIGPEPPDPKDVTIAQKQQAIEQLQRLVYEYIDFDRASNASIGKKELLDYKAEMSRNNSFAGKTMEDREFNPNSESDGIFSPESFRRLVRADSAVGWKEQLDEAAEDLIRRARRDGWMNRPVEVAIDTTDIPFYPQSNDKDDHPQGVVGTEKSENTMWAYKFATITAKAGGRVVTLASFPVLDRGAYPNIVRYLMEKAGEFVNIDVVVMDSEFKTVELLHWLDENDYKYIVQYPKNAPIKRMIKERDYWTESDQDEYTLSPQNKEIGTDVTVLLERLQWGDQEPEPSEDDEEDDREDHSLGEYGGGVPEDDDEEEDEEPTPDPDYWRAYFTNIDVEDGEELAYIRQYKRRWRIESSYRVIKDDFLARTTSENFALRVFYFLFAKVFNTAWVMLDLLLRQVAPDGMELPDDRPVISAYTFGHQFYNFVDPG